MGDARQVCDLAEAGDPLAVQVVAAHGAALGAGMANLVMLYAPDVIALGGGLMRRYNLFCDPIQSEIRQRCRLVDPAATRIVLSSFGIHTGLVGAALVWQHRYMGWQV
jgi:glucokinase